MDLMRKMKNRESIKKRNVLRERKEKVKKGELEEGEKRKQKLVIVIQVVINQKQDDQEERKNLKKEERG